MPSRGRQFSVVDTFRSLVLNRPVTSLGAGEAVIAENVELHEGTVKKRRGWRRQVSEPFPDPITSVHRYVDRFGGQRLYVLSGRDLYEVIGGDAELLASKFVGERPGRLQFAATANRIYWASSGDVGALGVPEPHVRKHNPQTKEIEDVPGSPAAQFIQEYSQTLFVAGEPDPHGSRLRWSRIFPFQDEWPALNFLDVQPGDGDRIMALARIQDSLLVLKRHSIHRVTGTAPDDAAEVDGTLNVTGQPVGAGPIAPGTVAVGHNTLVYLSEKGLYAYDGVQPRELTEEIRPLFDSMSQARLRAAVGAFVAPFHYILSLTSREGIIPDTVVSVRLSPQKQIVVWKNLNMRSVTGFENRDNEWTALFGTNGGVLADLCGDSDDGDPIRWRYRTGRLHLGDDPFSRTVRKAVVWHRVTNGSFNLALLPDYASENVPSITVDSGLATATGQGVAQRALPGFGTAQNWQLELSGESPVGDQEIHKVILEVYPKHIVP